jgi:hypothetical protein
LCIERLIQSLEPQLCVSAAMLLRNMLKAGKILALARCHWECFPSAFFWPPVDLIALSPSVIRLYETRKKSCNGYQPSQTPEFDANSNAIAGICLHIAPGQWCCPVFATAVVVASGQQS